MHVRNFSFLEGFSSTFEKRKRKYEHVFKDINHPQQISSQHAFMIQPQSVLMAMLKCINLCTTLSIVIERDIFQSLNGTIYTCIILIITSFLSTEVLSSKLISHFSTTVLAIELCISQHLSLETLVAVPVFHGPFEAYP